jgi:membrane-associated protease RseP (regulator of RpoE activity)
MEPVLLSFLLVLGVVAVLLVHELGHLLAARYYGIRVLCLSVGFGPQVLSFSDRFGTNRKLRAFLIGGSCTFDQQRSNGDGDQASALTPLGRSAVVLAARPVVNLLTGLLLLNPVFCTNRVSYADDVGSWGIMITRLIADFSIATALFNLLPLLPLDGGWLCLTAIEAGRGRPISQASKRRFFALSVTALAAITLAYLIRVALTEAPNGDILLAVMVSGFGRS